MDTSTLMLIIGFVTAAAGIAALVAAYQIRVKTLTETIDQQTQLAARNAQLDAVQNRLELTQSELEDTRTDYTRLQTNTAEITGMLKNYGYILPDADPLALTQEDIVIEASTPQTTATQKRPEVDITQLPLVPGLTPQELLDALTHAANKDKRKDRPFSRRYMTKPTGPLKHGQFNTLLKYLLENDYLETETSNSPTLTESGQALLKLVR